MTSDAHVETLLAAAGIEDDPTVGDQLREALVAASESERREAVRLEVARRLREVASPIGAGALAVWLGAGVEAGFDPHDTLDGVADTMSRWCRALAESEDAQTANGVQLLGQGLVAHLVRDAEGRTALASDVKFIEDLETVESVCAGPPWVLRVLRQTTGEALVIHTESRAAVIVRYENIEWNFELFSLLQDALTGTFRERRRWMLRNRGEVDYAGWHYGRGDVPNPDLMGSIWGEMSPAEIPTIDGVQVILLWPPIMNSRGWSGFSGPVIESAPPAVTVDRTLTSAEVDRWWSRLGLP